MKVVLAIMLLTVVGGGAAAERLPIDARMIANGERSVRGWTFNAVESFKPFGGVMPVMLDGMAGVRLSSAGKQTQIYHSYAFPVKAGETLVLSARVRGRGRAEIGFFAYGDRWAWKGNKSSVVPVTAALDKEPVQIETRFTVPEGVRSVRPALCVRNGDEVEFYDIRLKCTETGTLEKERE